MMTVSVIVPVYRVESTLDRCVASIVDQTYQNLQIILVDDGSPDRCPQLCDAWQSRDARIEVIHKENGGLSDARNAGLAQAAGEAIVFVDSDDYLDREAIETMVSAMQRHHADLVICSIAEETADGSSRDGSGSTVDRETVLDAHECFRRSSDWRYIPAWNKLYAARLWQHVKFPKGLIHEDEFVFHQIVDQCSTIVVLPNQFYHYVDNSSGIMHAQFSVRNLARIMAFAQRLTFFVDRGYGDCVSHVFGMMLADLGRAAVLADQHPEDRRQVAEAVNQARSLPFAALRWVSMSQRIRFMQLKCCPHLLLRELGVKHRQWLKHAEAGQSLR